MKLHIEISLDNAAIVDGQTEEVRRILNDACDRIPEPLTETSADINLRDANGNHIGFARIT